MALAAIDKVPCVYNVTPAKSAALTVFPENKAGRSLQPTRREELYTDWQPSDEPRSEMTAPGSKSWLVRSTEHHWPHDADKFQSESWR